MTAPTYGGKVAGNIEYPWSVGETIGAATIGVVDQSPE